MNPFLKSLMVRSAPVVGMAAAMQGAGAADAPPATQPASQPVKQPATQPVAPSSMPQPPMQIAGERG